MNVRDPPYDCQLEVAVDEFARGATPAEQTRSGPSWSAMRRLCLQEAIPQTATLVGVAMSANEGEHQPWTSADTETKGDELLAMQVSLFRWKAIPALGRGDKSKQSSPLFRTQLAQTRLYGTRKTKSQQHSERCRVRFKILRAADSPMKRPRTGSQLHIHQTQKYQNRCQGQQQPSSAA